MGGSQQRDMPIDYHHVCEYVSCIPVSCLGLPVGVPGYSSEFQYLLPHKESFPDRNSCFAFPHSLRSRYDQRCGTLEDSDIVVQVLSCCPPESALTGT